MRNMFDASIDGGSEYMENFGKRRGRKLRKNEYVDEAGYIRRSYSYSKGSSLFDLLIVIGILVVIVGIVKYWDKIVYVSIALAVLSLVIFFIYKRWRR